MNLPSSGLTTVEKSIQGFLYFKMAEGLSQNTIINYQRMLSQWAAKSKKGDLELSHLLFPVEMNLQLNGHYRFADGNAFEY